MKSSSKGKALKKSHRLLLVLCFIAIGLSVFIGFKLWAKSQRERPDYFQAAIAHYAESRAAPSSIIFIGSSSIRGWRKSIEDDFAPLPVVQRGINGAQIEHVIFGLEELVIRDRPCAVVLYVGENDLLAGDRPTKLLDEFKQLHNVLSAALPSADLWLMSVKPSIALSHLQPKIDDINKRLKSLAEQHEQLFFIDSGASLILNGELGPYYADDGLHLNKAGYQRWTEALRPSLLARYAQGC